MNDAYRLLRHARTHPEQRYALATIIAVDGSSYRRQGARMLLGEDGSRYGTISAGCLEDDLEHQARRVMQSGRPKVLQYDLRSDDDLSWGQGAGCNGNIRVYVEPFRWAEQAGAARSLPYSDSPPSRESSVRAESPWERIEGYMRRGLKAASARWINAAAAASTNAAFDKATAELRAHSYVRSGRPNISVVDDGVVLYAEDGIVWRNSRGPWPAQLIPALREFLAGDRSVRLQHLPGEDRELLFELYQPRERLYIFGAGPDVEPLARLASAADFHVTVIDPSEERCDARHFPTADRLETVHPASYLYANALPSGAYVLVMTHRFRQDQAVLRHLADTPLAYLGVLGSRARTERLLHPDPVPSRIHSPVGLGIGAEGPDEISVSIVSELIQIRSGKRRPPAV